MKTNKWIHIAITVGLALVGLVLGLVDALSYGVGYRDESVQTVFLESEEDIRAMGDSFYNNICYLENDITVSDLSVLADSRHPFVGVFDGQGHTITLTGDAAVKSLFGYIGEGGIVKNLRIHVEEASLTTRETGAALALENAGRIENCRVTVKSLSVELRGHYAAVAGLNSGEIEHVFAEVGFVGNLPAEEKESSTKLVLAAVAAYNKGSIASAVTSVTYRNIDEANGAVTSNPASGVVNRGVGAAVGNNLEGGSVTGCYALIEEGANLYDIHTDRRVVGSSDASVVYAIPLLFEELGFDENLWVLRNKEPVFIQGD